MTDNTQIIGAGGGGGGKGGSAHEAPNSLFSDAKARIILAYSEGEVGGLIGGLKNVYLDDTRIQNDDGSYNFHGLQVWERHGLPDQPVIPGFSATESTIQINQQVKQAVPITREISAATIDATRIIMTFPSMLTITDKGDQYGASVSFMFEVMDQGIGVWENRGTYSVSGKNTAPYQRSYRLQRPAGNNIWFWRCTRLTADSQSSKLNNDTYIQAFVEIEEQTSTYPNTAMIAIEVNTAQFGSSIPKLSIKCDGVKVPVPTNYNQANLGNVDANVYNGVWDGGFKMEATSNPIWNILELITNGRFGIGLPDTYIDKFAMYKLARYCDAVDVDGNFVGVDNGLNNGQRRPRFTLQTQITQAEDAWQVLNAIASSLRAITYWGAGVVTLNGDMPKTSVKLITNENVVDGQFVYSSTEKKQRYTTCEVTYNDPDDFFKPDIVRFEDPSAVQRYGRNVMQVTKYGCANRSEAMMYAKWMIDTAMTQREIVNFHGGPELCALRPGDVFEVADSKYQGGKFGGRVMPGSTAFDVIADQPVTLTPGQSYSIRVVGADGQTILEQTIAGSAITGNPTTHLSLISPLPETPTPEHVFVIAGTDIKPRQFTCISMKENEKDFSYEVVGVYFDPHKFDRVESDHVIPDDQFSKIDLAVVLPVSNITFSLVPINDPVTGPRNNLNVMWNASPSRYVTAYEVLYRQADADPLLVDGNGVPSTAGQFRSLGTTSTNDITIENLAPGIHQVVITAINVAGRRSQPTPGYFTFGYGGTSFLQPPVNVAVKGGGTTFATPDLTITWDDNPQNVNVVEARLKSWKVQFLTNDAAKTVLATGVVTDPTIREYYISNHEMLSFGLREFIVDVRAVDTTGAVSAPGEATISNPAPATPTNVHTLGFFNAIRVTHDQPTEPDAAGVLMFASKTSPFTANNSTLVNDGVGTFHDAEAEANTTYYVKIAVYDTFSKDPALLNISSEYTVATVDDTTIVPAPNTPTGLGLTTSATNGVVYVDATWTALAAETFTSYELAISEGGNSAYVGGFMTGTNSYRFTVGPATTYYVKVRAKNGVKDSDYGTPVTITSATVTGASVSAPAAPTGLAVTAGFKDLWLSWTNTTSGGPISGTEIWESATNNRANATLIATVDSTAFLRGGLTTATTRYYWLRATGAGGASAYYPTSTTAGVTGTTLNIATADYANLSIVNAAIADATIDDAKIANLDANKIKANSIISNSVVVGTGGSTLATVQTNAAQGATAYSKFSGAGTTIPSGNVEFNFATSASKGGNALNVDAVGTQSASTVQSAVINFNSNNDRNGVTPSTPGLGASPVAYSQNANASVDMSFQWTFSAGSGAGDIDGFLVIVRASSVAGTYTFGASPAQETVYYVTPDRRAFILSGVAGNNYYTFGVQAYRVVDSDISSTGFMKSGVAAASTFQPTANVAFSGDITGTINGTSAATVVSNAALGAQDPATRINANSTTIDPGKILISGSTTLSNWRNGGDNTKIEGGSIAANTITANSLKVGARNVQFTDLAFTPDKVNNVVTWTAGKVVYVNDSGAAASVSVSSGATSGAASSASPLYIYWVKDATSLSFTATASTAYGANNLVLATYTGSINLVNNFGGTIIDGDQIVSGTIKANRIEANSIGANQLTTGTFVTQTANIGNGIIDTANVKDAFITTAKIGDAQITTSKIGDAQITTAKIGDAQITNAKIVSLDAGKVTTGLLQSPTGLVKINLGTETMTIVANNFQVVPSVGAAADQPFAIVNGVTYIADAKIRKGAVTQAIEVQGNTAEVDNTYYGGYDVPVSTTMALLAGANLIILGQADNSSGMANGNDYYMRLYINGTLVQTFQRPATVTTDGTYTQVYPQAGSFMYNYVVPASGNYTIILRVWSQYGGDWVRMTALEARR